MADENPGIRVSANAGLIDGATAAFRYAAFLVTAVTAILGLLRTKDVAGLIAYIQANGGDIIGAASGLIAFAIAAYGIGKTWLRGSQVAEVAAHEDVPNRVAALK
jgi:hypothetical protein